METVPTQDLCDGYFSGEDDSSQENDANSTWGRLFPLGESFVALDLTKDEYSFGRGENCDVPFNNTAAKKHQCFQAYSKVHFKLIRQSTSAGVHVFLEDTSSNGTFVNGEKVGKGNRQVLANNDEISLALKKNKAFMYMDLDESQDADIPQEIKNKYTLTKTLGRGACGEVRLAFSKGSCEKFAVKIISKKKFTTGGKHAVLTRAQSAQVHISLKHCLFYSPEHKVLKNLSKQVMSEVKILKSLKHPCIIGIEDVIDTPEVLYIVLELVEGGELFDKIVSINQYDEPTGKLLFYQMLQAVKYLHDKGITHRDLKPENILLSTDDKETLIKVTDFGLSKFVDAGSIMKTFCGTPTYLAPEILETAGMGAYTKAIDVWSLGVILFICLSGYPPFSDERKDLDLPKQILGGHYTFPKQYWKGVSEDAIDLIKKMMQVDPKKRITLAEAVNHPWLNDEEVQEKAKALMFQEPEMMGPPAAIPKKRSIETSPGDGPLTKKRGSDDTTSPPTTPLV